MKYVSLSLLLLAAAPFLASAQSATPTKAVQPERVVELFTSQGCSSCPPANKFVAGLANDPDTLVLSYGVTYWDYLGWKDTFGKPEFTARQRAYGKVFSSGSVYTPQIVLNGAQHKPRYTKKQVERVAFATSEPQARLTPINTRTGMGLAFTLDEAASQSDMRVVVVGYTPGLQSVNVERGENRGRTLELANVVTDIMPLDPNLIQKGQMVITGVETRTDRHYVALMHDTQSSEIIGTATYTP